MLNMFDAEANVIQTRYGLIPAEYLGLHRSKRDGKDGARELVVTRMKEADFLIPHIDKDGGAHDAEPRTIQTPFRSEEHTSELQSLMRISYAVFCLKKKNTHKQKTISKENKSKTTKTT